MRALILVGILACASAAPSGDAAGLAFIKTGTVDPGDVEAAVIDAKVSAEDRNQMAADRARDLAEQSFDESQVKLVEKTEQALYSAQDKVWQSIDAVNTAAAKLDGAAANDPNVLTRSIIIPSFVSPVAPVPAVLPPTAPIAPVAPISPVAPIVYTGLYPGDQLKQLKDEKELLEQRLQLLERERMKLEMFEKDRAKLAIEQLEKEKERLEMFEKERIKYALELLEKEKAKLVMLEQQKQGEKLVKTADPDKKEEGKVEENKSLQGQKNLEEKPAVLLYSIQPDPWSSPLYYQNQLVLKQW